MSTPLTPAEITAALIQRGLLPADTEPLPARPADRPWFIGAVLGFAGWLAGIFGMAFVWMVFDPSSTGAFVLIGAVLLTAAFGLYKADRDSAFFDQLALALSIAGQIALCAAAGKVTHSSAAAAALVAVLQCVLAVVMPNAFAKLLAAFFACIAWALALRFAWWGDDIFSTRNAVAPAPALLTWALIWTPVMALAWWLATREAVWMASGLRKILRPVLSGVLLGLSIGTAFTEPLIVLDFWTSNGPRATNWLSVWPLLDVAAALVAALCAFRVRNTALVGVAIAASLLHGVQFYFLLGTTLLVKSAIMLGVGALLLAAGMVLRKRYALPDGSVA